MFTMIVTQTNGSKHKTEWLDPMTAIAALMHDCKVDLHLDFVDAEVFLEVDGKQVRQLHLHVD